MSEPDAPEPQADDAAVAEVTARLKMVSKAYKDLQDEMSGFRTRMEASARARAERQATDLVARFLEPVQNLRRSIEAASDDPAALREGLEMVHAQFMEHLLALGLAPVPGVGSRFDPTFHEAVSVVPTSDVEPGTVVAVASEGWMVGGKALVAARVVLAAAPEG